jgi:hypothetical protein
MLLPAARTTLQWVEGKKSFWRDPFPASAFTSLACTKADEEKQACNKIQILRSTLCGTLF